MTNVEEGALAVLKALVGTFGSTLVQAVLNDMLGPSPMLVEDVSMFVAGVLRAIVEVAGEGRVRAEVESMFNAGDVAADVVENKVFGAR